MTEEPANSGRRRRGAGTVTIKDVARHAGVSAITVSRVLNQPSTVSEQTRERVEASVRTLGYVPNRLAGGLASASTRVVPVIVPSLSNIVFVELINGVQERLEESGYQILLGNTGYDLDREARLVETLLGWSPAGAVVAGLRHRDSVKERLRHWGRPVVEVMEYGDGCIDMNVGLCHEAAGEAMARHLVERGYRRIAFIGTRLECDYRAAMRFQGHRSALAEAGLCADRLIAYEQPSTFEVGASAVLHALAEHPGLEAIHFANDDLAVGAILQAQRSGIAVPDDVAIAGFNGLSIGNQVVPRLTTVVSPRYRMGRMAADMLVSRFQGEAPAQAKVDVGFHLDVREST